MCQKRPTHVAYMYAVILGVYHILGVLSYYTIIGLFSVIGLFCVYTSVTRSLLLVC
jgi:hypothetical protein